MTAEEAADNAMNPDATEAEKQVTASAEAHTVLTLVQAAAAAPSRVDNVMVVHAVAEDAMNADATEVQALVIVTAEASAALKQWNWQPQHLAVLIAQWLHRQQQKMQ